MKQVLRDGFVALGLVLGSMTSAAAQVSVGVWLPGVSIGINQPVYPQLVAVPGYPVYYAPQLDSNYFFYDGMYWVYQSDNWFASSWYNGPWGLVGAEAVPVYLLRVPVRYYRMPPPYFAGWHADKPPRWDEHWGNEWKQRRSGWDQWDHRSAPPRAPLPTYQRQYSGNKYPPVEQQAVLQREKYKYQPRDVEVRPHYQERQAQGPTGKSPQRESTAPRQQQQAPRPPEQDRGSQGKASQGQQKRGSQDKGLQDKGSQGKGSQDSGSGHSSGQGQGKDGGKGEQSGGQRK